MGKEDIAMDEIKRAIIAHLDLLKMFSDVPGVLIRINEMEE